MRTTPDPRQRRLRTGQDSGFTLVETLVAMSIMGVLVAIAAGPWANYSQTKAHKGSAGLAVSALRNAQVAAVAERTVYRVDVAGDGSSLTVYRTEGGTDTVASVVESRDASVSFSEPAFTRLDGSASPSIWFYPRGSASAGTLKVVRDGRDKEYIVTVEGLTGRVSYE